MGNTLHLDDEEPSQHCNSFRKLPDASSPNPPSIHFNTSLLTSNKTETEIITDILNSSFLSTARSRTSLTVVDKSKAKLSSPSHSPVSPILETDNKELTLNPTLTLDLGSRLCKVQSDEENSSNVTDESSLSEEPIKTIAGSLEKDIRQIYKFKEVLGGGHFGTVRIGFRRLDPLPHKLYAIKSISKKHLTKKDLEELTKEVDIISSLDHPNIINFYETYHDQLYFHIVMELCSGKDLFERVLDSNMNITERKVAMIIMKVLHAISYCHLRGITHRDLKPENILFESSGVESEIKLIDFGLSKKHFIHEKMHTILGTPYYVAPEVLKGDYDEKCDIWSIGALTYLMLTGEPPFKGDCNNAIFQKILKTEVKFDVKKWKNLSKEAMNFVKTCLDKNPDNRPNAIQALTHEWFSVLLTHVHSSILINKDIMYNIQRYTPCCNFKKYVLKYFINLMGHQEIKQYKNVFYAIDFNHDGTIDKDELEKAFELSGIPITNDELKRILSASIDPLNKQSLDYTEFIMVCLNLKEIMTKEKVETAFNYFDIDNSGHIEASDVYKALLRFGKKVINEDDVYKMIREVTKSPTKQEISFDEFAKLFPCCFNQSNVGNCNNNIHTSCGAVATVNTINTTTNTVNTTNNNINTTNNTNNHGSSHSSPSHKGLERKF